MDKSGSKSINIKAKGGSITSGQTTVTGDFPTESQVPEISVSGGNHGGTPSGGNLTIEALESDISVAENTAIHIRVQSSGSDLSSRSLSTDSSPPFSNTEDTGATTLHFLVHEKGKYIQIGQCCVIVEMHVNESLMEKLKSEGTLEVDTQIGTSVVTMRWRGTENTNEELGTQIKLRLTSSLTDSLEDLERSVLEDLVNNHCDKCQAVVTYLVKEMKGRLTEVSLGCLRLTLLFTCQEDLERGTSEEALKKIQEFFNKLLVTEKLLHVAEDIRFSATVEGHHYLAQGNQQSTTLYKREDKSSNEKDLSVSEKLEKEMSEFRSFLSRELTTLRAGQSREIMTQEQLASQVASQVQQIMTQEWELFRQMHVQALHNAVSELLPELEQRVYKNVLMKIDEEQALLRVKPSSTVTVVYPVSKEEESTASSEDEISRLLKIIHSKPSTILKEVKVDYTCSAQALNFSSFFDAIQKPRDKEESEKESLSHGSLRGTYENLVKIWGEDGMKVVQRSLKMATAATEKLDDHELSDQFVTVLCLDLSHTMAGTLLKKQRAEAEKIVENSLGWVAVVSISDEIRVEQDFTKERDTVRKVVGQLDIKPLSQKTSTPVLQAIFTVLKLLHRRVKSTDYGQYHTPYPKIVLISDGLFNDCSQETEKSAQPCQKTDDLFSSVLEVMAAMNIRIPIHFVPMGEQRDPGCKWMDMVMVVKDVNYITNTKATEAVIGSVMEAIMRPKEARTPWKSWQMIKKELKEQHKEIDRVEWFITEHFKQPPPIGTRVQVVSTLHQPTESEHFKQPSSLTLGIPDQSTDEGSLPTATVLQHVKGQKAKQVTKTKYVLVVLDTGEKQFYPWSFDQERLMFYQRTVKSATGALPVGTLVRRGSHWNYKNQDGGPDEIGVVIKNEKFGGGSVKVCWRSHQADQELNVYRYGDQDRYDIEVIKLPLIDLAGLIDLNYRICEMRGETLQGVGVLQREESVARNKTSRVIPDDPYMEIS
ncbi:uncharacterized protein LOC125649616 isoform X2 [Ostrea edulis]|uniref:uncharacterized protein LOC125649616 isoform X2 n=1 Tax=Ostrea edulis TaxID=37623 RepID=UPI0024AEA4EE|nr:uncharacterized protein LOC125649616 isoform X2 [Ostrea edulis]